MQMKIGSAMCLACCVLCGLLEGTSSGQSAVTSADREAARALEGEADAMIAAHNYKEACRKLEESRRRDPASANGVRLAACYEKAGQLASARREYARAIGSTENPDRRKALESVIAELEPRVSYLTVVVPPIADVPGLKVTRDGEPLERGQWSQPFPIDAGSFVIAASATAMELQQYTDEIKEGEKKSITLQAFKPIASAPPPDVPAGSATPPPANDNPPKSEMSHAGSFPWFEQRTVGFAVGGVGVASVIVGSIFGIKQLSDNHDALGKCPDSRCATQEEKNLHDESVDKARTSRDVAYVGFGLGGAALVAGAVLVLTAPKQTDTKLSMAPVFTGRGPGFVFNGRW